MILDSVKNFFFAISIVGLLISTVSHNAVILNNIEEAETVYSHEALGVIVTCLFAYVCVIIFALFVLGNLNDYLLYRIVNPIGIYQKLRVICILFAVLLSVYTAANMASFYHVVRDFRKETYLLMYGFGFVATFSMTSILSIFAIHPDLLGFRHKKTVDMHNAGLLSRQVYI